MSDKHRYPLSQGPVTSWVRLRRDPRRGHSWGTTAKHNPRQWVRQFWGHGSTDRSWLLLHVPFPEREKRAWKRNLSAGGFLTYSCHLPFGSRTQQGPAEQSRGRTAGAVSDSSVPQGPR